jgi:hypothetical protein
MAHVTKAYMSCKAMPFVCRRIGADDLFQRHIKPEEIVMTYAILSLIEAIEVLLGYRARRSCSVPSRPQN